MPVNEAEHERWNNYDPHDINIWHERWLPREKKPAPLVKSESLEAPAPVVKTTQVTKVPQVVQAPPKEENASPVVTQNAEVVIPAKPEVTTAAVSVAASPEPINTEAKAGFSVGLITLLAIIAAAFLIFIFTRGKDEKK